LETLGVSIPLQRIWEKGETMIVERWTFATKSGCWDKMLELLEAERKRTGDFDIYTCFIGARQAFFATELRFESLSKLETYWSKYASTPEGHTFIEAFEEFASNAQPWNREIWDVK
jgi:hypothetical protein